MKENYKSKKYLRAMLADDKIEEVLEYLEAVAIESEVDDDFNNAVIVLSGEYKSIILKKIKGTVLSENLNTEINSVRSRIAKLISIYIKENVPQSEQDKKEETFANYKSIVNELAFELAMNYVNISFGKDFLEDERNSRGSTSFR